MKYCKLFTAGAFFKQAKSRAQKNDWNLKKATRELAKDVVLGYLLYYGLLLGLLLIILSILSFSSLLGGPYLLAQILLFLVAGTTTILFISICWLWQKIQVKIDEFNQSSKVGEVHEASVVDGEITSSDSL
jgi:hypothetical protein